MVKNPNGKTFFNLIEFLRGTLQTTNRVSDIARKLFIGALTTSLGGLPVCNWYVFVTLLFSSGGRGMEGVLLGGNFVVGLHPISSHLIYATEQSDESHHCYVMFQPRGHFFSLFTSIQLSLQTTSPLP